MVLRVGVALGVVTTSGGASVINTSLGASNIPLGCVSEGIWLSGFDEHSILTTVDGQSNTSVAECRVIPGGTSNSGSDTSSAWQHCGSLLKIGSKCHLHNCPCTSTW